MPRPRRDGQGFEEALEAPVINPEALYRKAPEAPLAATLEAPGLENTPMSREK